MKRSEMRLYERSIRNRWPITDKHREVVVAAAMNILAAKESKPRDRLRAMSVLMAAERQNQADEHKAVDCYLNEPANHNLDAIAADLGVDPSLIEDAEAEASRSDSGAQDNSET